MVACRVGVCHIPAKSLLLKIRGFREVNLQRSYPRVVIESLSEARIWGRGGGVLKYFFKKEISKKDGQPSPFDPLIGNKFRYRRKIVVFLSFFLSLPFFLLIYIPVASMNTQQLEARNDPLNYFSREHVAYFVTFRLAVLRGRKVDRRVTGMYCNLVISWKLWCRLWKF